jgi:hypothetical protein
MSKHFAKVELEIKGEKREIIIKESTVGIVEDYIIKISNAGDNFMLVLWEIVKELSCLSKEDIRELTFSDLDDLRKGFMEANKIFFRGVGWIGLSKKLEAMMREVVEKISLQEPKA